MHQHEIYEQFLPVVGWNSPIIGTSPRGESARTRIRSMASLRCA